MLEQKLTNSKIISSSKHSDSKNYGILTLLTGGFALYAGIDNFIEYSNLKESLEGVAFLAGVFVLPSALLSGGFFLYEKCRKI
ncbi:MAG: hypothetical protein WCX73_01390 [Candidatus Pacearchaeota archaeon]|jgi:hypothetical protein